MYRLDPATKRAATMIGATTRRYGANSPEVHEARQLHAACTAAHYIQKLADLGPIRDQDRDLILSALNDSDSGAESGEAITITLDPKRLQESSK